MMIEEAKALLLSTCLNCNLHCDYAGEECRRYGCYEALQCALTALDKQEKYRWHDLRKDPTDLPKKDGLYWVHGIWGSGKISEGECEFKNHDGYFSACWNFNVIAWREIEPFEVSDAEQE